MSSEEPLNLDFGPAMAFSQQMRDPGFRARLVMAGYYSGMPILVVGTGRSWGSARSMLSGPGPALMARQCETAAYGWELVFVGSDDREVQLSPFMDRNEESWRRLLNGDDGPDGGGGRTWTKRQAGRIRRYLGLG